MTSTIRRFAALAIFALTLVLAPAGVSAKVGESCGGFIGDVLCGKGEFCQHPTGLCISSMPGVCASKPKFCPHIYLPVCGCNGKTYSNDCVRERAGVSKMHDGKC